MVAKSPKDLEIVCPCCEARLSIDAALSKVISYESPPKTSDAPDLDRVGELLKEQKARREAIFTQSQEDEKTKTQLLDKKFQEALKKSKGGPVERPTRDIDL